jgi:hypothetical protein
MPGSFQERAKWAVIMIALFVILGGLAALQYRWSKRLTEAIQARVDTSLKASLMDWHLNLLHQITEPCFAMQIDSEPDAKEDWNKYYQRYEAWLKTAKFPGMFANLYLIRVSKEKGDKVYRFDTNKHRFLAAQWGSSFENLERELRRQSANPEVLERKTTDDPRTKIDNAPGAMPHDPLFGWHFEQSLPALVHPLIHSDVLSDPRDRKFKGKSFYEPQEEEDSEERDDHDADNIQPVSWIVIELDAKVLQQQVLPELAHWESAKIWRFASGTLVEHLRERGYRSQTISIYEGRILGLSFKHENGRLFIVVRRGAHVKAIQFRRPEGSAGARPRRCFADNFVMIRVFLLVHENIPNVIIASIGKVNTFLPSEVHAVHALYRRKSSDLFTRDGIHWHMHQPSERKSFS